MGRGKDGKMPAQKSAGAAIPDDPNRDTRFDAFRNNPIYRKVPQSQKRVQIDSRFKSMFHGEHFKLTYKVDKRGRPVNTSTNENLKKYYHLQKDDSKELEKEELPDAKPEIKSEPESEESDNSEEKEDIEGNITESEIKKRDKSTPLTKVIKKKLHSKNVDFARGEGTFVSEDSESDDSSSSEEEEAEDVSHAWGELDKDAERTEESTCRLALCNMDWDKVKAVDLMVLFHSFIPPNGLLKCVTIYPSEFGKQRLAEEDVHGPLELQIKKEPKREPVSESDSEAPESEKDEDEGIVHEEGDDEEEGTYHMERLRKYQLSRLKYYYAVLEFDSKETAEKVYTECDGMEYESSATHVDLRYIPDDMTFEETDIKDQCNKLADAEKYRPRFFTTTALQQAKVDLTWDETDPLRQELTERVYDPKSKVDDDDLRAYLASSSESEEEINDSADSETEASNADPMAKYRALLESIEDAEKKKKGKDVEMEITWGVGLKDKTESKVKERLEKEAAGNLTPWEEMLAKKKEKSKKRKQDKKKQGSKVDEHDEESVGSENDNQLFSDDDVEVDLEDPFFQEEMRSNALMKSKPAKKKDIVSSKPDVSPADKAALELLLMDDEEHKNHFSLKSIMARETESKSKKKKFRKKDLKKKDEKKQVEDNFELNVTDDRFSALFSSHLFNVDPSDPNFKDTKAMKTIVTEKQKRRLATVLENEESLRLASNEDHDERQTKKIKTKSAELSVLVKNIKRNTSSNFKAKSKN